MAYAAVRLLILGLMTLTGRPRLLRYEEPKGDVKMLCRYLRQPVMPLPIAHAEAPVKPEIIKAGAETAVEGETGAGTYGPVKFGETLKKIAAILVTPFNRSSTTTTG